VLAVTSVVNPVPTLGQYELRELLGQGGMGVVYLAHQPRLKRDVAVKVLLSSETSAADYARRFNREAEIVASLEHPNIIPIYDYGIERAVSYLVMRWMKGGTLADRLRQADLNHTGLPSLSEISKLLTALAGALDHAHSRKIIHRDIKPGNILFDEWNNPFLADFGLAKLQNDWGNSNSSKWAIGTPAYMAPELWDEAEAVAATDQYALGVTIYALVTGTLPFSGANLAALMRKHVVEMPTPLQNMRAEVPEAVWPVLQRTMAKSIDERFPTITAFAQAFEKATQGYEEKPTTFFDAPPIKKPTAESPTVATLLVPMALSNAAVAPADGAQTITPVPEAPVEIARPTPARKTSMLLVSTAVLTLITGVAFKLFVPSANNINVLSPTADNTAFIAGKTATTLPPSSTMTATNSPTTSPSPTEPTPTTASTVFIAGRTATTLPPSSTMTATNSPTRQPTKVPTATKTTTSTATRQPTRQPTRVPTRVPATSVPPTQIHIIPTAVAPIVPNNEPTLPVDVVPGLGSRPG
jgi:serine/threonine protein kinase